MDEDEDDEGAEEESSPLPEDEGPGEEEEVEAEEAASPEELVGEESSDFSVSSGVLFVLSSFTLLLSPSSLFSSLCSVGLLPSPYLELIHRGYIAGRVMLARTEELVLNRDILDGDACRLSAVVKWRFEELKAALLSDPSQLMDVVVDSDEHKF